MRISCDMKDFGFQAFQDALRSRKAIQVFVDGEFVKDCITADEEEGFAYIHCRDSNGKFVVEGDYIKSKRLAGTVRVKLVDRVN